jgi:hypothetical protein
MVDFNDIARKVLTVPTEKAPEKLFPRKVQDAINFYVHKTKVDPAQMPTVFAYGAAMAAMDASGSRVLADALEGLLEAIPRQTNDADWWPDELTDAVFVARAALEQFGDLK